MTKATVQHLRSMSEQYVRGQLQHFAAKVPKKDVRGAIEKVNAVLVEMEKAKAQKKS